VTPNVSPSIGTLQKHKPTPTKTATPHTNWLVGFKVLPDRKILALMKSLLNKVVELKGIILSYKEIKLHSFTQRKYPSA
jgi:hypothetical protein